MLPDSNEIIGYDQDAPTLEVKSLILTILVGDLYGASRKESRHAFSRGYNIMKDPIFTGFKISGCLDTTKAKVVMADHLLNKYGYILKDSVYLDTVYRIEIIDSTKLPIQNDDCNKNLFITTMVDSVLYSIRPCLEWNSFFTNIVHDFCHRQHCYALEIPEGSGKMAIQKPVLKSVSHDVKGLQAYYEEEFGLRITQERIDSVDLVLFKKHDLQFE